MKTCYVLVFSTNFVDNLLCSCQAKLARAPTSPDICCVQQDLTVAKYAIQIQLLHYLGFVQQDPAVANYAIQIQLYKHLCLQVILEFRFQLNLPF